MHGEVAEGWAKCVRVAACPIRLEYVNQQKLVTALLVNNIRDLLLVISTSLCCIVVQMTITVWYFCVTLLPHLNPSVCLDVHLIDCRRLICKDLRAS